MASVSPGQGWCGGVGYWVLGGGIALTLSHSLFLSPSRFMLRKGFLAAGHAVATQICSFNVEQVYNCCCCCCCKLIVPNNEKMKLICVLALLSSSSSSCLPLSPSLSLPLSAPHNERRARDAKDSAKTSPRANFSLCSRSAAAAAACCRCLLLPLTQWNGIRILPWEMNSSLALASFRPTTSLQSVSQAAIALLLLLLLLPPLPLLLLLLLGSLFFSAISLQLFGRRRRRRRRRISNKPNNNAIYASQAKRVAK